MNYKIGTVPSFDKQVKRLAKKFVSLRADLKELADSLKQNPHQGVALGKDCYKIRLAIRSKGRGKSGGSRVITHVQIEGETVYLLSIYDKSEKSTLNETELDDLLTEIDEQE
jgi:mRNA-degrading endonuclease RelE of RelBE toxin-antitoxin system